MMWPQKPLAAQAFGLFQGKDTAFLLFLGTTDLNGSHKPGALIYGPGALRVRWRCRLPLTFSLFALISPVFGDCAACM